MVLKNNTDTESAGLKPFKIVYIINFVFMILTDIVLIILIFTVWMHLEYSMISILLKSRLTFLYYMFIISPIVKVGFEGYEIVRFLKFLKSDNREKEGVYKIARGFMGTRMYRIYYIIIVVVVIFLMEISQIAIVAGVSSQGEDESYVFYFWFGMLLYANLLPLLISPQLITFSIDHTNKKNKIKAIMYSIIWIILLALFFNMEFIFLLTLLFS